MYTNRIFRSFMVMVILTSSISLPAQNFYKVPAFGVLNYNIHFRPEFEDEKLKVSCEMLLQNQSDSASDRISLLLYRLLEVNSVVDENHEPLSFSQQILSFEDWKPMQVNFIEVMTDEPVSSNDSVLITLKYEGFLAGYTETGMKYVRDKIDSEFTILRPDCYAYPVPGVPNEKINRSLPLPNFDYRVKTTVPDSLTAVNGGKLEKVERHGAKKTYTHSNIKPAWRIDVCIAAYQHLNDQVKIHYFPEDSIGAQQLLTSALEAMTLYTNWWGPLNTQGQFSIIEIPDGYGSQADVTAILQTASAFKDQSQMRQVYHELTHLWNVKSQGQSSRWNEGLATFLEYHTAEKLQDKKVLDWVTDWYIKHLKERLVQDSAFARTPFGEFGKAGLTGYSYSLGMIFFRLAYELIGAENFHKLLANTYKEYSDRGISDDEFMQAMAQNEGLTSFIKDWYYTTDYQKMIVEEWEWQEIVTYYKSTYQD